MVILTKQDFRGRFEITFPNINGRDSVVESTLDSFEKEELYKLFGKDLATHLMANPNDPIYDALYEPILEHRYYSEGLKQVLLSFIYLRYQKGNYSMSTENGRVLKDSSTSIPTNPYVSDITMYNNAVNGWRAIQMFSRKEYTDFKGIDKRIQMY